MKIKYMIYQHLMRWMHKRGIHKLRSFDVEGDRHELCDWCGLRRVKKIVEKTTQTRTI